MWLSWSEHVPIDGNVTGSILGQGIYPGFGLDLQLRCMQEGNQSVSLSQQCFFLSLSKNIIIKKGPRGSFKKLWLVTDVAKDVQLINL